MYSFKWKMTRDDTKAEMSKIWKRKFYGCGMYMNVQGDDIVVKLRHFINKNLIFQFTQNISEQTAHDQFLLLSFPCATLDKYIL